MNSIRDPIKQEENVNTRTRNDIFITDVHTHTHMLVSVQHEASYAIETLQQLQLEDRELQHHRL